MLKRIFIVLTTPIWTVGIMLTMILLFFVDFIMDIVKYIKTGDMNMDLPMLNSFINIVAGDKQ